MACIYDNSQSVIEDLPDALNAQRRNGRSPTDYDEELQYSSEAAGWAAAIKPRGAKQGTPAGTPATHLSTSSQR
jgi:hypothetical protein